MIKVGMMVEVIDHPDIRPENRRFIGHRGVVLMAFDEFDQYMVDGVTYELRGVYAHHRVDGDCLKPINEKDANTVVSFESLKEATGWTPRETA